MLVNHLLKNRYIDSVVLMSIGTRLETHVAVHEASLMMGTEPNRQLLSELDLLTDAGRDAGPNDCIVALKLDPDDRDPDELLAEVLEKLEDLFAEAAAGSAGDERAYQPHRIATALRHYPGANLALISVPGQYARWEAERAMAYGLHVMIFSDNVPIEDEIALKRDARRRGLLLMGPDCGTAIIGGAGLGFANAVRSGTVGVVGAAGTGVQAITSAVHRRGCGISQAVGVGGRDLSAEIGGMSMLAGIDVLESDPNTAVIVIVSKPPDAEVALRVLDRVASCAKPVVVNFVGGDPAPARDRDLFFAAGLDDAAALAVALVEGAARDEIAARLAEGPLAPRLEERAASEAATLDDAQRSIRGLYAGGTLCDEAQIILDKALHGVRSNIPVHGTGVLPLDDRNQSVGHTITDMGDDAFTRGRPHPMIDATQRCERLLDEARDPSTAVILFDVVLGYGAEADPSAPLAETINAANAIAAEDGRRLVYVATLLGTDEDPQEYDIQRGALEAEGVHVFDSHAAAVRFAAAVASRGEARSETAPLVLPPPPRWAKPPRSVEAVTLPAPLEAILHAEVSVVNIGLQRFTDALQEQKRPVVQLDWRPPAAGDPALLALLRRLL